MAMYDGVLYAEGTKPLTDEGREFLHGVSTKDLCDELRRREGVDEFSFDYEADGNKLHLTLDGFGHVFVVRD